MPYRSLIVDKTEIKIYILYVFRALKNFGQQVSFELISDVITWEGAVNYFDFSEQFSYLVDNGMIAEIGKEIYDITEKGEMIADTMEKSLLATVRESACRSIMRFFSFKNDKSLYLNEIVPEDSGWRIRCYLKTGNRVIVEANLYSDNKAYLEKISLNFEQNAVKVIDGIVGFMTGDIDFFFKD